ncbi:MAG: hypothetical protein QME52_04130 [Bacteroidota bacterium]|nr:hypothetical protein [Bacteroidota bacterium]
MTNYVISQDFARLPPKAGKQNPACPPLAGPAYPGCGFTRQRRVKLPPPAQSNSKIKMQKAKTLLLHYSSSFILVTSILYLNLNVSLAQTEQQFIFKDDFKSYENGSSGNPPWHPVKGNWQIIDGTYFQQSTEYDCASMLDIYLKESFEIEVLFEHLEGEPGIGFIFSSHRRDNIEFSQMVRFDGSTVLLTGYFQSGEFTGTTSAKTEEIKPNRKYHLAIRVDRDNNHLTVSLDKKEILLNAPIKYLGGYLGLQSSAGRVQFHQVILKKLPMNSVPINLNWVKSFAITPAHQFLIPDEINGTLQLFDDNGNEIRKIGTPAASKGQLHKPNAVAMIDDTTIIITDRGSNQIHKFTLDGKWIHSIGWKGSQLGQCDEPVAVASNSNRQIFVVDKNNNRIQVFDDHLNPIAHFGTDKLREPVDLAIQDSIILIVNAGYSQIELFKWIGKKGSWIKSISYGGGEGRGIAIFNNKIYLSVVNEVRAYDTSGVRLHSFKGRSIDFILPQQIKIDKSQNIYIGDYFHSRIVQTKTNLLDPEPLITSNDSSSVTITWESDEKRKGDILISSPNSVNLMREIEQNENNKHSITLKNLIPKTTYSYEFSPTLKTIPKTKNTMPRYTFTTTAGMKTKIFARLPMVALIFTNVIDTANINPQAGKQPLLPESEIDRIKNQLADGVKFYWIHSGMRLFLDLEIIVVRDPLYRSDLYGSEWWYPPKDTMIEKYLELNHKDIKNYRGILYLTCTQWYDTTKNKYIHAGKGGGFTNGIGTGKGFGISWWDVTRTNHNAGNNWLMVHEFNHQLDDIFLSSGYPEYWFNHISPTIGTAGPFGEHFDANAYILKIVPPEQWYDLKYTTLEITRDTDEDGIPDSDLKLPLDEVRLHSDSTKTDTDGDGVSDFEELSYSNWIKEGWGETYGGTTSFPMLSNKDSDGDGVDDKNDLAPCYSFIPEIYYSSQDNLQQFVSIQDERIRAVVQAGWNEDSLFFHFELDRVTRIKIMMDGNADGWFLGRDNYLILLTPKNDSIIIPKVQILNATDPKKWPFIDQTLTENLHLTPSISFSEKKYRLKISIPKNIPLGFQLQSNQNIGLLFGFECVFDDDGSKRYLDIFEPNRFFITTLKK